MEVNDIKFTNILNQIFYLNWCSTFPGTFYLLGGRDSTDPTAPDYKGCIQSVVIDGQPKTTKDFLPTSSCLTHPLHGCSLTNRCSHNSCQNGGQCKQGYNHFYCSCEGTGYAGAVCHASHHHRSCKQMMATMPALHLFSLSRLLVKYQLMVTNLQSLLMIICRKQLLTVLKGKAHSTK